MATVETPPTTTPGLWRHADWLRLWTGNAVTVLGSSMASVAFPLVAYAVTRSVGAASVVASTQTVGYLVAGPVGGLVVDRVDRRRVMVAADVVGLSAYALLAVALWRGTTSWWPLVAVALVTGVRQGFSGPAHLAAVRRVVGPARTAPALAHQQSATTGAQMVGPPAGGLLYAAGAFAPFLALALAYLVDLVLVLRIRCSLAVTPARPAEGRTTGLRGFLAEVTGGFRFMWAQASLRAVLVFAVGINLCTSMFYVGLDLRLVSHGVRPVLIGLVDTSASAGAFVGALAAAWLVRRVPLGRLVLLGCASFALVWVPLSFTGTNIPLTCALSAVALLGVPAVNAGLMGFAQTITPDELQGRVSAAGSVLALAAQPSGPLLAGALLAGCGAVAAGLVPALLALGLSAALALDPGVRGLGRPDTWGSPAGV